MLSGGGMSAGRAPNPAAPLTGRVMHSFRRRSVRESLGSGVSLGLNPAM